MRFKVARTLFASVMALTMATASNAADIKFTLTGLFDINLGGTAFDDVNLTLDGIGSSPKGITTSEGFPIIVFSSLNAIVAGFGTFAVPSSIIFYFNPASAGPAIGEGGFIDTTTGNKVLTLQSPAFTGYDGETNLVAPGLAFQSAQGFETPFGRAAVISASNLDLRATVAVPEPATWAMLIGGFAMVGGAMRRRQKLTVRYA